MFVWSRPAGATGPRSRSNTTTTASAATSVTDGGIILYRSYQTEDEELAVVQATLTGLLRDCIEARPRSRGASSEIEVPAPE